ncbi:hypothetical protein [Actinoplanes solisilvae]|uniref:hypothetical protein n=1 Tax=Actinoplanes solisilvae TaxID=2486853 RepID=UPI000FDCC67E|nr:hypothetical protein [Actinoplanes solisilvae]
MAFRTRAKLVGAAFGAAALVGAGQLGLAYGLGVLDLTRAVEITARDGWTAELAWVAWFAMTAAAAGGLVGRAWLPAGAGATTRLVAGTAAGFGAALIVPLTMQPARSAQVVGVDAVFVIGACAILGAVAGVLAAYAALGRNAARWSLATTSAVIWLLALVSVAPTLRSGDKPSLVRLGVLDAGFVPDDLAEQASLATMPAIALICGLVIGIAARRKRLSMASIALAGLPGPALLTLAYLIAGPGSGRGQELPYWAAMTATGAGVLGSVLIAVLGRGPAKDGDAPERAAAEHPPLPQRDAKPDSAIAKAANSVSNSPLPGAGAAQAITGRAAVSARASVAARAAAQRPAEELRPSDTGVITMPPFDGFAKPQSPQSPQSGQLPPQQQRPDGEISDWVSGLGRG